MRPSKPPEPIELFYSYAHQDDVLRDELEKHLSMLRRQGIITNWHFRRITAGNEFKGQIDEHLNRARVILLLISADFLSSDYCFDIEMKRALERHEAREARIIPIILRPCDWEHSLLGGIQALPKDRRPVTKWHSHDEAFENVARGIRAAIEEMQLGDSGAILATKQGSKRSQATPVSPTKEQVGRSLPVLEADHLISLVTSHGVAEPVLLLGGGASQKSGIPLRHQLVERAVKWAYCRTHQLAIDDPTIRPSDLNLWLRDQSWYDPQQTLEGQYVVAVINLLQTTEERRNFFREVSRPPVPPSLGYHDLLQLMAVNRVRVVLTTNFDSALPALASSVPNPHHLTIIRSADDYRYISTAPTHPQLVYLHKDAERYSEEYFENGYEHIDPQLPQLIIPLLRDHPLVVIGYSGSEPSVMRELLMDSAAPTHNFQHGLYWCRQLRSTKARNPLVQTLADAVGSNFHLVGINDFDGFMGAFRQASQDAPRVALFHVSGEPSPVGPFDMRIVSEATIEELDWTRVEPRLLKYCQEMRISIALPATREILIEQMLSLDLARRTDGVIRPTVAGLLLFGSSPTKYLPTSKVAVHVTGETSTVISGNLWEQLKVIDSLESDFNKPFRLKGRTSETVTPYPPLALKEIVVNALAHRRYDTNVDDRVNIHVERDHIKVTSPGGLDERAIRQLPPNVAPEEVLGRREIRAYRNPVIADFLCSSGDMDKLGSGLIDVRREVEQNGGTVQFNLGADNTYFEVVIYRRPETPEEVTGAATALTVTGEFITNVLELVQLPEAVWSDETHYRSVLDILSEAGDRFLPAFVSYNGRLYAFTDLSQEENPLREFTRHSDVRIEPLADFAAGDSGERRLVNLLNQALRIFCEGKGLVFDWKRKRAYFTRTGEGARTITYKARLRQATRTVVKPRVSTVNNRVVYWEHQAVDFRFKRFGESWGLQLLPTYFFTFDGYRDQLPGDRIGPLATHRMSREYNVHVDSHLVFWTVCLSDGAPEIALEQSFGSRVALIGTPASLILRSLELQPEEELPPPLGESEVEDFEAQLSDFIDEEGLGSNVVEN